MMYSLFLQVNRLYGMGDYEGAKNASLMAERLIRTVFLFSLFLYSGIILFIISAVLFGVFYAFDSRLL